MRLFTFLACFFFTVGVAVAQTVNLPPPADPKPPEMLPIDDSLEPEVRLLEQENQRVEEYRINGRLYKIVITPKGGVPYTLIDPRGDGSFVPAENGSALSVPMWTIGTF